MATAQDLIKAAMHNIGKLAPDEALSADDADVGLSCSRALDAVPGIPQSSKV